MKLCICRRWIGYIENFIRSGLCVFFFIDFLLICYMNFNNLSSQATTFEKFHELRHPIYYLSMFFINIYFLFEQYHFARLLQRLSHIYDLSVDPQSARKYYWFCLAATVILMLLWMGEHLSYEVQHMVYNHKPNGTFSEEYFEGMLSHWKPILSDQNTIVIVFCALIKKLGPFTWVFGDVIVVVKCRALVNLIQAYKSKLHRILEHISFESSAAPKKLQGEWISINVTFHSAETLSTEILSIAEVIKEISRFISPLVMICMGVIVNLIIVHVTHAYAM